MRYLILIVAILLISCKNPNQYASDDNRITKQSRVEIIQNSSDDSKITKQSRVEIILYDISISTDQVTILGTSHISKLYDLIAMNGGGVIYGIHIKSNSAKQDPIRIEVPPLELLPVKGNPYQQSNRKMKNEKLLGDLLKAKRNVLKQIAAEFIIPKNNVFSDIKGALELARQIMTSTNYAEDAKNVFIISDMINDLPPQDGEDRMNPVFFDSTVRIFLVRPSPEVQVDRIVPNARISSYVNIIDAIDAAFNGE